MGYASMLEDIRDRSISSLPRRRSDSLVDPKPSYGRCRTLKRSYHKVNWEKRRRFCEYCYIALPASYLPRRGEPLLCEKCRTKWLLSGRKLLSSKKENDRTRMSDITQNEYSLAIKVVKRVLSNKKLKKAKTIEEKLRERIGWAKVFSAVGVSKPYKTRHTVVSGWVRIQTVYDIHSDRIAHLEPASDVAVVVIDKSNIYFGGHKVKVVVLHR